VCRNRVGAGLLIKICSIVGRQRRQVSCGKASECEREGFGGEKSCVVAGFPKKDVWQQLSYVWTSIYASGVSSGGFYCGSGESFIWKGVFWGIRRFCVVRMKVGVELNVVSRGE